MKFSQSPRVTVRKTASRGWGVFAKRPIACDELIERVPVLVFPKTDLYGPQGTSQLADYVFTWDDEHVAIALGYGSLYNHSYTPNARYADDDDPNAKRYFALRDIATGEEITVNYNAEPDDGSDVGFEVR